MMGSMLRIELVCVVWGHPTHCHSLLYIPTQFQKQLLIQKHIKYDLVYSTQCTDHSLTTHHEITKKHVVMASGGADDVVLSVEETNR